MKIGDKVKVISTTTTNDMWGHEHEMKKIGDIFTIHESPYDYDYDDAEGFYDENGYIYHKNDLEIVSDQLFISGQAEYNPPEL